MEQDAVPTDLSKIEDWLRNYLQHHRAQQFTINGFTYPFVRELHFASLPYPSGKRKYSMLGGLFAAHRGDLLFMFQSDPQWPDGGIDSRRGLRGLYRVVSEPFADSQPITMASTGYTILGKCPSCGTAHATLSPKCVNPACQHLYPTFTIPVPPGGDPYRLLNLHLRIDIEPLLIFERAISDERAYADMKDWPMIWIGRHDNQMGKGKGSSVRQLLPEEAIKITRMLISEPDQRITSEKKKQYPNVKQPILNEDGTDARHLEIKKRRIAGDMLMNEFMLNFDIANTIDKSGSSIQTALGKSFVHKDLEYFSTEFPWGYTSGTSDFVATLAENGKRYRIIIMEFKRDLADDYVAIQVSLYVPWVTQVITQFANPQLDKIEVVPVFICRRLNPDTCIPKPYSYRAKFVSGASLDVMVESPQYIEYEPTNTYQHTNGLHYAKSVSYTNKSNLLSKRMIKWTPPEGTVTSDIERDWVKRTSWAQARTAGGF